MPCVHLLRLGLAEKGVAVVVVWASRMGDVRAKITLLEVPSAVVIRMNASSPESDFGIKVRTAIDELEHGSLHALVVVERTVRRGFCGTVAAIRRPDAR